MRDQKLKLEQGLDLLAARPKMRILRHLVRHPSPLIAAEVARVTGTAYARASEALKQLVEQGLLKQRRVGRAIEYVLNERHYLVSEVLVPAFRAERRWPEALGEDVTRLAGPGVVSVVLYGSVSRGKPRAQSDLDLAVLVERETDPADVERHLAERYVSLQDRFVRPISFLVLDARDFSSRAARGEALVANILRDGRVLAGMPIEDVLARFGRKARRG